MNAGGLLDEHRVTQLLVELRAVRLLTYSLNDALELRVGVPFTLRQADGDARRVDPAEPEQLAPLQARQARVRVRYVEARNAIGLIAKSVTELEAA